MLRSTYDRLRLRGLWRAISYKPNPTILISRNFVTYLGNPLIKEGQITLRRTGLLERILAEAAHGYTADQLINFVVTHLEYKNDVQAARNIIKTLCKNGALLPNIFPSFLTSDGFILLEGATPIEAFTRRVCQFAQMAEAAIKKVYRDDRSDPVNTDRIIRLCQSRRLQFSSTFDGTTIKLRHDVANEAAKAAQILLQISNQPRGPIYLREYKRSFIDRYGATYFIPILEVFNESTGIGLPHFDDEQNRTNPYREQVDTLNHLIQVSVLSGEREIDLTENDLKNLATDGNSTARYPISLDLTFSVIAKRAVDLNAGKFQIVISPSIGARAAGRSAARFGPLLGPVAREAFDSIAEHERREIGETIDCELVYVPDTPRSANLQLRSAWRKYELPIFVAESGQSTALQLNDLALGIRDERFLLWSIQHAKAVRIFNTHLLTSNRAPGFIRLLCDLSEDGIRQLGPFPWGHLRRLPFLPRVRYGRIVLSPASWTLVSSMWRRRAKNRHEFFSSFEVHRKQVGVPALVYLTESDNRLLLNLDNKEDCNQIRRALLRGISPADIIQLTEFLPSFDHTKMELEGHEYFFDVVAMLRKRKDTIPTRNINAQVIELFSDHEEPARQMGLASCWIYMKIYCAVETHESLLVKWIVPLLQEIKEIDPEARSFFVRYKDAEDHIRLRVWLPSVVRRSAVSKVSDQFAEDLLHAGAARRVGYESYEREVSRYGGPGRLDAAERLFSISSEVVLSLLTVSCDKHHPRAVDLCGTTLARLLLGVNLDGSTVSRALRNQRQINVGLVPHPSRPARSRTREQEIALPDRVNELWARRSSALAQISADLTEVFGPWNTSIHQEAVSGWILGQIHMHINRFFGFDPTKEESVRNRIGGLLRILESQSYRSK